MKLSVPASMYSGAQAVLAQISISRDSSKFHESDEGYTQSQNPSTKRCARYFLLRLCSRSPRDPVIGLTMKHRRSTEAHKKSTPCVPRNRKKVQMEKRGRFFEAVPPCPNFPQLIHSIVKHAFQNPMHEGDQKW